MLNIADLQTLERVSGCSLSVINAVCNDPDSFYYQKQVPKKDGSMRLIRPPQRQLKLAQRKLLDGIARGFQWPKFVTGGTQGRSIIDHARPHVGRMIVATLDVQNFFPNTTYEMVANALEQGRTSSEVSKVIAGFTTCFDDRKVRGLPQGSPTSSFLANLVFLKVDRRLSSLAKKNHLRYTRYIDDLAFSGDADFTTLKGPICEMISEAGYVVAKKKVFFRGRDQRQIITGLVVNDKLRPCGEFIDELRYLIKSCFWPDGAGLEVVADEQGVSETALAASIEGRIAYVKQFDPKKARELVSLKYSRRVALISAQPMILPTSAERNPHTTSKEYKLS